MSDQEYRIIEEYGWHRIEVKVRTSRYSGALWWKKSWVEEAWHTANMNGLPAFLSSPPFFPPPEKAFKTLKEARARVAEWQEGPKIHKP